MTKRFYPTPVPGADDAKRDSQPDAAYFEGLENIQLEEDAARARAGSGYNPYDTVPNVREPDSAQRYSDLRRLSEWIRMKRQQERKQGKPHGATADSASLEATLPGDQPFWPARD